jgi:hypothetical protein
LILTSARGKTKIQCECGAQTPRISDEALSSWKTSEEGRTWLSAHRPHGKTAAVERGGRGEALDDRLKRIEKKRTKASQGEINELAAHFEKRT